MPWMLHAVEIAVPCSQLRPRLHRSRVLEGYRSRPQNLAHRIPRYLQLAHDLLDRLALNEVLPPDPANRLHNQHPPPPGRHPKRGSLPTTGNRGSKLDADHPSTGVNLPRRITAAVALMPVATRRRCPPSAGLTQRIGRQRAATFSEACRAAENRCPSTLSARLPWHGKHCCPCRRPPAGSPPAWLRAPGLGWCKHREGRCGPEDEDDGQQATPQTSKERRQVRCRRGEPAGSRPPAHTPTAPSTGSVKGHGDPDR